MKQFVRVSVAFFSLFSAALSAAPEIDLIYNTNGLSSPESLSAWHGARIASDLLGYYGYQFKLVLYNGHQDPHTNHAIGAMRSKEKESPIVIGIGYPSEIKAAAEPLLSKNKIFIAASSLSQSNPLLQKKHFFSAAPSIETKTEKLIQFNKKNFPQNGAILLYSEKQPQHQSFIRHMEAIASKESVKLIPIAVNPKSTNWLTQVESYTQSMQPYSILLSPNHAITNWVQSLQKKGIETPVILSHSPSAYTPSPKSGMSLHVVQPNYKLSDQLALSHFKHRFEIRFHKQPSPNAYAGYNAVMLAAYALNESHNAATDSLSAMISSIRNDTSKSHPALLISHGIK